MSPNDTLVVDASVVVKWYVPERDHEPARAIRDEYINGQHSLIAPSLLPYEVVNALRYCGPVDDESVLTVAETLPQYGIDLIPFDRIQDVAAIALDADITVYDAAYVALAAQREAPGFTADERLLDVLKSSGYERFEHVRTY